MPPKIPFKNSMDHHVIQMQVSSHSSRNGVRRLCRTISLPPCYNTNHNLKMPPTVSYTSALLDEVTGEWRKLHNAELHALYPSPDIIRNIKSRLLRWAGHIAHVGESRNEYRVLVGRREGKRPLRIPRRKWEDNIKIDLREMGYDDSDCINLAQDRDRWRAYVRTAMNLRKDEEEEEDDDDHGDGDGGGGGGGGGCVVMSVIVTREKKLARKAKNSLQFMGCR
ncbi:hypothetical protein ANN_12919 [Periplaneta americana]|uniref:Uncharacterized protein n=1 Tax=Periplaneta americana TaxID=6978 RepID=A0ABQ8TK55_PERAM|nr:hypothetical protein ANN_12919 [Periplaneta americana]